MWLYDNYEWWVNAIHSAVCPAASEEMRSETPFASIPDAQAIEAYYRATLNVLRGRDMSPGSAQAMLFRAKALRKWRLADASTRAIRRDAALRGFIERNSQPFLQEPIPYPYCVWMREVLKEWLPIPVRVDGSAFVPTGRFGPGACAEHYTHCQRLLRLAMWCYLYKHWPEKVDPDLQDASHVTVRLCAVPKTATKDRLITVEPAYGTFAQQYVREYILEAIHQGPLCGTTMDLGYTDGQAQQRALALQASKNRRLATLDLKDASDNIGWLHIRQVFPPHIVSLLETTRSEKYQTNIGGTAYSGDINMFAGMGNATTFAVETLFFSAFVYAYARAHGLPTYVRTFGDDIICTSQWAQHFLENEGMFPFFQVGADKSFWGADYFRESCGTFAYKGVDINSPKVDGYSNNFEGRTALCDLHTRLRTSGVASFRRLAYLIAQQGVLVNWPFVIDGYPSISDDLWASTAGAWTPLPQTRWNSTLYRREAWVAVRHPIFQTYSLDWKRARARNQPEPELFVPAVLSGQAGSAQMTLSCHPKQGCTSVRFPVEGSYHYSQCWRPVRPPH